MSTSDRADWQTAVAPYVGADVAHSLFQLVTTLTLLAVAFWGAYWASAHLFVLTVVVVPLASALLIRSFMLMHDCAHGSFLPWKRANNVIGAVTGILALTPFDQWRRDHAIHHASSGDLDRRGHGDVTTWTVREYLAKTPRQRLFYRLYRNPIFLLTGGPVFLAYSQRFQPGSKAARNRPSRSIWGTNVAIVVLSAAAVLIWGWRALALYGIVYYIAAMGGVWLFYVQHQFEDTYWEDHPEWDYETSAIRGSSHLRLPGLLQWFTASIGLHHVHHLAPRIPNYRLQRCHDENPQLQVAPVITIPSGLAALRLALWDEDRRRLVRFRDVAVQG